MPTVPGNHYTPPQFPRTPGNKFIPDPETTYPVKEPAKCDKSAWEKLQSFFQGRFTKVQ